MRGRPVGLRRGAALLPSLLTTGNLFLGYVAIIRAFQGRYAASAELIGGAILLDMLDGRVARLTGTTSEFGGELDSLADSISFGVAPAVLAYSWAFDTLPRWGWITSFAFLMCGVFRLARFNVQRHSIDGRYFVGLPIPMGAAPVAALVHFTPGAVEDKLHAVLVAGLVLTLAMLMVSTFRYHSFKGVDLRKRRSYLTLLGIVMLLLPVALFHEYALLSLASVYALSGPVFHLLGLLRRRGPSPPAAVAAGESH